MLLKGRATMELRSSLPALPRTMRDLRIDKRGYPVPYFVQWINGEPEFRIADRQALHRCVLSKLCWICGKPLGDRIVAFVIGPMCAINRVSAEPPQHPECAEFAVRSCPFMLMPKMVRREDELMKTTVMPGHPIVRNPGVMLIWMTRRWEPMQEQHGYLFSLAKPVKTLWYAEGRAATRAEVLKSIISGVPSLLELVKTPEDHAEYQEHLRYAMTLLPKDKGVKRESNNATADERSTVIT